MKAYRADAAGNRFVVIDGVSGPLPSDPAGLARRLCTQSDVSGFCPEGLLLCLPGEEASAVRMMLFNRDGSRPEACGNGLRIIALLAVREQYAEGEFLVTTDAGLRQVRVTPKGVEVCLGPVRIESKEHVVELNGQMICGTRVNVGNPHFVLFMGEQGQPTLEDCGEALATHESFPKGTNVAIVSQVNMQGLSVRIFERGVGETGACGTGAAAVALVAVERGLASWPVRVELPGGDLVLSMGSQGVWLRGSTEILGSCDLPR
jgi:diaminopimelate epimerase